MHHFLTINIMFWLSKDILGVFPYYDVLWRNNCTLFEFFEVFMPTSYFPLWKTCPYQFWDKMYDFLVIYSVFCTFSDFLGSPPLQGLWRHLVGLTYLKKKIICQLIKPIKFLKFCKKCTEMGPELSWRAHNWWKWSPIA